ncbi:hypothetical protein LTR27_011444 [Elasticomyces elasticus]|nr:hypothetical protein LTR27_011444 [Elasticomyces elasticus]
MLGRTVGIATLGAISASALILPPGIASETSDLAVDKVDPKSQSIIIPCSACAFPSAHIEKEGAEADDALFWIQGGANSLMLHFTVSEDGLALLLGGETVYKSGHILQLGSSPHVTQVPSSGVLADIKAGKDRSADLVVTSYGVSEGEKQVLSPNDDRLEVVKVQIMSVEDRSIELDEVEIRLLRTGEGELLIMEVTNGPGEFDHIFNMPPHEPKHKQCSMLPAPLCKLRNMLESKFSSLGASRKPGCNGRKGPPTHLPGHIRPPFMRPGGFRGHMGPPGRLPGRPPMGPPHPGHPHGRPHHMRPHGSHHGHHHQESFWKGHYSQIFIMALLAIVVPVITGIVVGMTVSLIGLVVGRLISYVWIKFVRGGRRGYSSVALEEAASDEDDEKVDVAEMEAPPVYQDAPAYEEVEKEVRAGNRNQMGNLGTALAFGVH